jgi:hypothetical protein
MVVRTRKNVPESLHRAGKAAGEQDTVDAALHSKLRGDHDAISTGAQHTDTECSHCSIGLIRPQRRRERRRSQVGHEVTGNEGAAALEGNEPGDVSQQCIAVGSSHLHG